MPLPQELKPKSLDVRQEELGAVVDKEMAATSAAIEDAVRRIEVRPGVRGLPRFLQEPRGLRWAECRLCPPLCSRARGGRLRGRLGGGGLVRHRIPLPLTPPSQPADLCHWL